MFAAIFTAPWVKVRSGFILALRSLWLHKLRAFLSVLGIIIGTAAVIALMAFGKGSMEDALADIRRQGTTNVIVKSKKPVDEVSSQRSWVARYGLTWDDFDRCTLLDTVIGQVPMRVFPQEVRHIDKSFQARLVATTQDYQRINQFEMKSPTKGGFSRMARTRWTKAMTNGSARWWCWGRWWPEEEVPFEEECRPARYWC